MAHEIIVQPTGVFRLGDFLKDSFGNPKWTEFRSAIAFVKRSGTKHIRQPLEAFSNRGHVQMSVGIDAGGTSVEGLTDLIVAVEDRGDLFVFKNANSSTFHPKVYLFKNNVEAELVVGSGNLTEGGLFTNYEASLLLRLNLELNEHREILNTVELALDEWSTPRDGLCYKLDLEFLNRLIEVEHLPDESIARGGDESKSASDPLVGSTNSLFKRQPIPSAPRAARTVTDVEVDDVRDEEPYAVEDDEEDLVFHPPGPVSAQAGIHRVFLMTLQNTDMGVGQTTRGTSRRSPEIFIPLICRDYDPQFWGWPNDFVSDANWGGPVDGNGRGKMDREGVMVRLGGDTFPVTIWYNPDKRDLRIRSEHIRSAGNVGDILYVERSNGASGFNYYVEVVPQSSARHADYLAKCVRPVHNSRKRWTYL